MTYSHDFRFIRKSSSGTPLDFGALHERTRHVSESVSEVEYYVLAFPGQIFVKLQLLFVWHWAVHFS